MIDQQHLLLFSFVLILPLFTLTFQENVDGHFSIRTKDKAGSCVLKLYSVELDCLVYRNKVTVKKAIEEEDIEQYLFDADTWKTRPETISIAGKFDLSFISNAPLTSSIGLPSLLIIITFSFLSYTPTVRRPR